MNTLIKQISLFIVLVLFTGMSAIAQQSDYRIQQNFRTEYNELLERIDQAETTDALTEIEEAINELADNYADHADLIDAATYPETYDQALSTLRGNHAEAVETISTIEDLNEQVQQLESEMEGVRSRLSELDEERSDLLQRIEESTQNEARQAALIRQYRENIEERNLFVSNFLGELLSKYQSMDSARQEEISEAAGRLEENPIDVIKNVINDYIGMMEQTSALQAPDYVSMRAQHGYFIEVWNSIGQELANTFAPDNPEQAQEEVNQLLSSWLTSINNNLWESLHTSFSDNGIELAEFSSSEEFYQALNTYIDEAYEVSMENNSEEDYQVYQEFNDYWNNTVKAQWGEMLNEGDILSQSQISSIDMKLDNWRDQAAPQSNLTFILLIVSIAVIIGLIVLLLTRKSGDSA